MAGSPRSRSRRLRAEGDRRRMRELAVGDRGTRSPSPCRSPYTLMVLAEPTLEIWLGERYGGGAGALTIMASYWLLYGQLALAPNFLVGAGKAREVARLVCVVDGRQPLPDARADPIAGAGGPALGHHHSLRAGGAADPPPTLDVSGASVGELAREAWVPAYALGALLAGALGLVAALATSTPPSCSRASCWAARSRTGSRTPSWSSRPASARWSPASRRGHLGRSPG